MHCTFNLCIDSTYNQTNQADKVIFWCGAYLSISSARPFLWIVGYPFHLLLGMLSINLSPFRTVDIFGLTFDRCQELVSNIIGNSDAMFQFNRGVTEAGGMSVE